MIFSDVNPTATENPDSKNVLFVNTTSGEVFVYTDNTTDSNIWKGQLGTNVP